MKQVVNILGKLRRIDMQRKFKKCWRSSIYEFVNVLEDDTQKVYMDVIYKYKEYREYANYLLNDTTYVGVGVGLGKARKLNKYKSEDLCKQDIRQRVIASIICKSANITDEKVYKTLIKKG